MGKDTEGSFACQVKRVVNRLQPGPLGFGGALSQGVVRDAMPEAGVHWGQRI